MSEDRSFSYSPLAPRCQDETEKFLRRLSYDPHYCFELFQHAFRDRKAAAFEQVMTIYRPLVFSWAKKHTLFSAVSAHLDVVHHYSFTRFWRATHKHFDFETLPAIMGYLSRCVGSAVIEVYREQCVKDAELEEWSATAESSTPPATFQELWTRICFLLPESEYQLLARRVLVESYKPAEVAALHPDLWPTARTVSVALQTILRRLRKDPWLHGLVDDSSPTPA